MADSYARTAESVVAVAAELGCTIVPGTRVLDFGCGSGALVAAFGELGLDAFGADVEKCWDDSVPESRLRVIARDPYRIPFPDDYFDLVTSTSVFEHVGNPEQSFAEIHRVLKDGGLTLNLFPGRWYLPFEPHIRVPLAGVLRYRWWLTIWALLGVRNRYQTGMDWTRVVDSNLNYLKTGVNYMTRREIAELAIDVFGNCGFARSEYVRYWHGGAAALGRRLPVPGYPSILLHFRDGLLFARRTGEGQ